jgi:hypothetical protein
MINIGVRALKAGLFAASISLLSASTPLWAQQHYKQTNLVSDIPGMAAITDPNLVNPWGIFSGTSGPATTLFFAAGIEDESHGLFGNITAIENVLGGDH